MVPNPSPSLEERLAATQAELEAVRREIEALRRENHGLEKENKGLEKVNKGLEKVNQGLRNENEGLRKELDAWKRGLRERRKRRSSRPEGKGKGKGKGNGPGREDGHPGAQRPLPDRIDDTEVHPPPAVCSCGGCVELTGEERSTIVQDIPPIQVQNVRHVAPEGKCQRCGQTYRTRLPGEPPQGVSIAQVQLGPNLLALAIDFRYERHVPLAGIAGFMGTWFGVHVTPSGVYQLTQRWKDRTQASYDEIVVFTRASDLVGGDETPVHQDGLQGWAWLLRTERSSLYRIELSRGGWVLDTMLGPDWAGRLITDFYSVYTSRNGFWHAYCGAHTIREAKKVAELEPSPATEGFRDRLSAWYVRAKDAQESGDPRERQGVKISLGKWIADERLGEDADVARLQARLNVHFYGVIAFVDDPEIPADNSACERDIRNLSGYRNMSGGTRSPEGSRVLGHWKSIVQTRKKNELPMKPWVIGAYEGYWEGRPPPSVFAEV